uniref:Uncharacterized protein n=1 Tax=Rhizophora mucronata TaxID=61149 RepID=A0A2P2QZ42_RHIMU
MKSPIFKLLLLHLIAQFKKQFYSKINLEIYSHYSSMPFGQFLHMRMSLQLFLNHQIHQPYPPGSAKP